MVKKDSVYLFLGEDSLSKDIQLKKLKEEFLQAGTEYFDLDILYAKELKLPSLQERLLILPVKAKKRIILIRDSQNLADEVREFLLKYVKKPQDKTLLILDTYKSSPNDAFIREVSRYAEIFRFKESPRLDTFVLSRSIDFKKTSHALILLGQLLRNGETPERILGGLRYSWENSITHPQEIRKKLKLLLNCDVAINTGRLRPDFALERLGGRLCSLWHTSG